MAFLIKEYKGKSLQFAKVFPTKLLKLLIHHNVQTRHSVPLPPFCVIWYNFGVDNIAYTTSLLIDILSIIHASSSCSKFILLVSIAHIAIR